MTNDSPINILSAKEGYNRIAKYYDSWRWYSFWRENETPIVANWLQRVGGTTLDAGSGNSPYLDLLYAASERLALVDLSENMLRLAKKKLHGRGNVKHLLSVGDLRAIPLASRSIRQIICTRVLSNISTIAPVFREFARILESGGRVLVTDIHPLHRYQYTRIQTPRGQVYIETYKHKVSDVIATAGSVGLTLEENSEFNLFQLRHPPPQSEFSKLYVIPETPIFYLLSFRVS